MREERMEFSEVVTWKVLEFYTYSQDFAFAVFSAW